MKETTAGGKTRTKSYAKILTDRWYVFPVALFVLAVIVFYAVIGENSYIAIADNLDLFVPQYRMLGLRNIYFAHGARAPFLDGISRDVLPSEFNIVSFLYMIFPPFAAYVAGYVCKVLLAVISFYLLGEELLSYEHVFAKQSTHRIPGAASVQNAGDRYTRSKKAVVVFAGLAYGMLTLFPNFGIAFSAIPLVLYLFIKLDRIVSGKTIAKKIMAEQKKAVLKDDGAGVNLQAGKAKKTARYRRRVAGIYALIFFYPLVSYFSYFGFFILAYATLAFVILSIRRKNLQGHIFRGICLLAAGYVLFEYRLFMTMLFGTQETIRTTMQMGSVDVKGIFTTALSALTTPYMHEMDVHQYFVMPICLMYFIYTNIRHIDTGELKDIFRDKFNMCVFLLLFNSIIAGLYAYAPFRSLVAAVLPPLTGFQFDRTTFFNPFLWYAMLAMICVRMVTVRRDSLKGGQFKKAAAAVVVRAAGGLEHLNLSEDEERNGELEFLDLSEYSANRLLKTGIAYLLLLISMGLILLVPTTYNDLRATLAGEVYLKKTGSRADVMNWKEFYSEELFTKIKEDIDYRDEWCVAYGMYPAVLEYNGICTLDGYLGFYPQSYKEEFRKIIAPALDRLEVNRLYFDNWGARCYLFSGTDAQIAMGSKSLYGLTDTNIYIDSNALKNLYGKYVFSRVKFSNADEAGLSLLKAYEEDDQAYPVYVYTVR